MDARQIGPCLLPQCCSRHRGCESAGQQVNGSQPASRYLEAGDATSRSQDTAAQSMSNHGPFEILKRISRRTSRTSLRTSPAVPGGSSCSNSAGLGLARRHLGHRPGDRAETTSQAPGCDVCHERHEGVRVPLEHLISIRDEKGGLDRFRPCHPLVAHGLPRCGAEPILRSPAEAAAAACRKGLVARRVSSGGIRR